MFQTTVEASASEQLSLFPQLWGPECRPHLSLTQAQDHGEARSVPDLRNSGTPWLCGRTWEKGFVEGVGLSPWCRNTVQCRG